MPLARCVGVEVSVRERERETDGVPLGERELVGVRVALCDGLFVCVCDADAVLVMLRVEA